MLDMHAHLACLSEEYVKNLTQKQRYGFGIQELKLRRSQNIATFFSCGTPEEWKAAMNLMEETGRDGFYMSFGIHPWYSDRYCPEDCIELLRDCDAVGEIGMDSVWCDIPLPVQRRVLERQLQIAADLRRPVILHTKGQEQEVADIIRDFPGKVCVHWYSGDVKTLERFIQMDCYFTLGPDLEKVFPGRASARKTGCECAEEKDRASGELYRYMLNRIPADRLFLETDGILAVAWARGAAALPLEEISVVLNENLVHLAHYRKVKADEMQAEIWRNLQKFLGNT